MRSGQTAGFPDRPPGLPYHRLVQSRLNKSLRMPTNKGETARDRMRRYRAGAEECRANAAKTKDLTARPGLIQFAQLCEILADSIEAGLGDDTPPNSN